MFVNYQHKYQARGKFIYEPTDECKRKGERLLREMAHAKLPDYFYHYRAGGHVAALHTHIGNPFFFKIDIQRFYYSIYRNRVGRALHSHGFGPARTFAKWSCVASPYEEGRYALPIGFVQSPLLASLVLLQSPVADAIERARASGVFVSVYFDDFIGSAHDKDALRAAYVDILAACAEANLTPSAGKLTAPTEAIIAFNCNVAHGSAKVTAERIAKFFAEKRSAPSQASFDAYCSRVSSKNFATTA
jgi:Reverse transcriptase (RNA-dependent DNA polymerase)